MSEMISPVSETAAGVVLINAMSDEAKRQDLLEYFKVEIPTDGSFTKVKVEMKINGVEVNFSCAVTDMWNRLSDRYEEDVLEKAKELVGQSKLQRLTDLLQEAEYEIETEIRSLFINNLNIS